MLRVVSVVILGLLLSSCASSMALSSRKNPDIERIGYGSSSGEVQTMLGGREKTMLLGGGKRIDFHRYKRGEEASLERSVFHGALSMASKGFWEILAVPFESYKRREVYLAVTYDRNEQVIDLNETEIGR